MLPRGISYRLTSNFFGSGMTSNLPHLRAFAFGTAIAIGAAALATWVASPALAAPKPASKGKPETATLKRSKNAQTIVVLVNDQMISRYDIQQRAKLKLLGSPAVQRQFKKMIRAPGINKRFKDFAIRRGARTKADVKRLQKEFVGMIRRRAIAASRAGVEKKALDELIDEALMAQAAKKLGIVVPEERITVIVNSIAKRNKMSLKQFSSMLRRQGTNIDAMRARFKVQLAWRAAVKRKFGRQISVGNRDLKRMMTVTGSVGPADTTELELHKFTLQVPGKLDQKRIAIRIQEAQQLRQRFKDCKASGRLAGSLKNVRLEKLGSRLPSTIPEPTRTLLLSARDGEMLQPQLGPRGIELYAVCSRRKVKADQRKREVAKQQLRQREFELVAKRYLKDLRQDAHIERR